MVDEENVVVMEKLVPQAQSETVATPEHRDSKENAVKLACLEQLARRVILVQPDPRDL